MILLLLLLLVLVASGVGVLAALTFCAVVDAVARKIDRDPFSLRVRARTCESCGVPADVRLRDDSTWCISCDLAARHQGYDNEPARLIRRSRP